MEEVEETSSVVDPSIAIDFIGEIEVAVRSLVTDVLCDSKHCSFITSVHHDFLGHESHVKTSAPVRDWIHVWRNLCFIVRVISEECCFSAGAHT